MVVERKCLVFSLERNYRIIQLKHTKTIYRDQVKSRSVVWSLQQQKISLLLSNHQSLPSANLLPCTWSSEAWNEDLTSQHQPSDVNFLLPSTPSKSFTRALNLVLLCHSCQAQLHHLMLENPSPFPTFPLRMTKMCSSALPEILARTQTLP